MQARGAPTAYSTQKRLSPCPQIGRRRKRVRLRVLSESQRILLRNKRLPTSIHRSAWNRDSRKLDFRFTEFSEVCYPPSNAQVTPKITHLSDTPAPIREYGTHVTTTSRRGGA